MTHERQDERRDKRRDESQEQAQRRRARIGRTQEAVLTAVAAAGLLLVAAAAPNTLSLIGRMYTKHTAYKTRTAARRLIESGHLRYVTRSGRRFFELTVSGRRHLDRRRTLVIKRPKKWDGKWRIVSFDIAQARRFARTQLRHTLQEIGFERLQDSVWVFPYDCEELITLLKADYGLGKEVLYIIADSIENDRALRGRFKLR